MQTHVRVRVCTHACGWGSLREAGGGALADRCTCHGLHAWPSRIMPHAPDCHGAWCMARMNMKGVPSSNGITCALMQRAFIISVKCMQCQSPPPWGPCLLLLAQAYPGRCGALVRLHCMQRHATVTMALCAEGLHAHGVQASHALNARACAQKLIRALSACDAPHQPLQWRSACKACMPK